MSLSRYYKRIDSFKAEEIVKKTVPEPDITGWHPDSVREEIKFQAESRVPSIPPAESPQPGPQHVDPDNAAEPRHTQQDNLPGEETVPPQQDDRQPSPAPDSPEQDVQQPRQPPPEPQQPEVDLAQYILITDAETQSAESYQRGFAAGQTELLEEYGTSINALNSLCHQLDTIRETILGNITEEIQEFALSLAERILRFSIKEQDQTIIATIEEALNRAVRSDEFIIYIHQDDYEVVNSKSEDIVNAISGLTGIVLKIDNTIEPGGARIESENCTIDATIAGQLESIREELKKRH